MAKFTRFQAVRAALHDLGGAATNEEVARYVAEQHGYDFPDPSALALYISMVNSKMNRKANKDKMPSKPEY